MFDSKGERVYYIRKRVLGLTQEKFGRLLGVSQDAVCSYEQGNVGPSSKVLVKIVELGGCSADWILSGKGKSPGGYPDRVFGLLNLKELGERIRYLREKTLKMSLPKLASRLGIQESELDRYEHGELGPSYQLLTEFANLADVSIGFLLLGKRGEKEEGLISPEERIKRIERKMSSLEMIIEREFKLRRRPRKGEVVPLDLKTLKPEIPVVASIPAGHPVEITPDQVIDWILVPDDALIRKGKEIFGIRVEGDSMSPELLDGDYVIVISQTTAEPHDIVVARLNGEAIIKEFVPRKEHILLNSANSDYPPILVTNEDDFQIIGVVYGIGMRKLKRQLRRGEGDKVSG